LPELDEDEGGFFVAFFVRLGLAAAFFAAAGFFAAAFFAAAGFLAVAAFFATGLFAAGFAIFLVTELLDAGLEAGLEARAAAIGGANSRRLWAEGTKSSDCIAKACSAGTRFSLRASNACT